jgi:polysaccharide export outer membrane protein
MRTERGARGLGPRWALVLALAMLAAPLAAQEEYRLGAGDVVRLTVYDNPDLQTETEVSESGTISFPLVGEVPVMGMTRMEAGAAVSQRLTKGGFLKEAHVIVRVIDYRSQQVAVLGEVAKPGKFPISRPTSVTELIAAAGGITAKGSTRVTVVQRGRDGKAQRYEIDVKEILDTGGGAQAVMLGAGDSVFVPPAPMFYIYGEVRQPGAYPLVPDMTVTQALSLGGGLTVRGTERGITIERKGKDGRIKSYRAARNSRLEPNDVVRVPESWF